MSRFHVLYSHQSTLKASSHDLVSLAATTTTYIKYIQTNVLRLETVTYLLTCSANLTHRSLSVATADTESVVGFVNLRRDNFSRPTSDSSASLLNSDHSRSTSDCGRLVLLSAADRSRSTSDCGLSVLSSVTNGDMHESSDGRKSRSNFCMPLKPGTCLLTSLITLSPIDNT